MTHLSWIQLILYPRSRLGSSNGFDQLDSARSLSTEQILSIRYTLIISRNIHFDRRSCRFRRRGGGGGGGGIEILEDTLLLRGHDGHELCESSRFVGWCRAGESAGGSDGGSDGRRGVDNSRSFLGKRSVGRLWHQYIRLMLRRLRDDGADLFGPFRANSRSAFDSSNPTPVDPSEYPLRLCVLLESDEADPSGSAVRFEENFEIRQKWRLRRTAGEMRAQEGQRKGRREPREEQSSRFCRHFARRRWR